MYGRSCTCLLVISFLIVPPAFLHGQSDRVNLVPPVAAEATSEVAPEPTPAFAVPPRVLQPSVPGPPTLPHLPVVPPGTIGFEQITRAAGTIFSGTVTAIVRRPASLGQPVETVAITFHVENAFRGVSPDETFTISQWMGLWSSGQRYRIGERVLLFLYPPSKVGLTSCVAAPLGRFGIDLTGTDPGIHRTRGDRTGNDAAGRILLSSQQLSAFRADPVLGGKSRVRFSDFAEAVRRVSEEK